MPSGGVQLTLPEAFSLCYAVGWRSGDLVWAVAVMSAESARYTAAYHINDDLSVDRGLFQINSIHNQHLHPTDAFDPVKNAQFAFQLSGEGTTFHPWAAYTNGAAQAYVKELRRWKLFHPWKWKKMVPGWKLT